MNGLFRRLVIKAWKVYPLAFLLYKDWKEGQKTNLVLCDLSSEIIVKLSNKRTL